MAERQARRRKKVGVVIPAAGAGLRMGGSLPKQFLRLGRRPIIVHTLAAFDRHPEVTQIVVVTSPAHLRRVALLMMRMRLRTAWSVVAGGANRQESVWNALGYELRAPQNLGVRAWQEAAVESMPPGTVMLFKQLRKDRVLRPI